MKIKRNAICDTEKKIMSQWATLVIWFCLMQPSYLKTGFHGAQINLNNLSMENQKTLEQSIHRLNKYEYKFKHQLYNASIPENSVGKTYAVPLPHEDIMSMVVDPGVEVKYRIVAGDRDKLFKAEDRMVGNIVFLAIRTRTSNIVLNREKTEEYVLKVSAVIKYHYHGKTLVNEAETSVSIKVLDRNDLSPLFYPTEYSQTIPEDAPVHKSLLRVYAEDADLGINGEIYYSFLIDNEFFAIHPTTGVIMLTRPLRYSDSTHFNLTVLANDRGSAINRLSHQSSKAKVIISVEKVNFYDPEIYCKTFSGMPANSTSIIYGIVKVTDKDVGRHGEIGALTIVDGDPDGNFMIKPTGTIGEYFIEINRFAKLNDSFVYNLTIRAEDRGTPVRRSYKTFPINIIKQKDNAPVFTKQLYEVSIPETAPPNMPVIRLKVADPDLGKNAMVSLEIVGGNEGNEFRINPESGMLYTQKPLDAEKKSFYTLTVTAIDLANVGFRKQSSAKVKINIQDMNDSDPIFEEVNSTVTIVENGLAGMFVTKLTAKDKDSGENAYISYSIANLNDVPFEIDHFTGIVRTTSLIDYETMRRTYTLSVRASDWGLPYRRQTQFDLLIKVKDINDNRPQFERVNCNGKVFRKIPVGSEIFTLSSIDFDVGDYITYRLISGNDDGCFNLDPVTGILSIGCDLTDVKLPNRSIVVSSTDGTHFSDEMSIHIELLGKDEEANGGLTTGYGTFECRETGVARRLAANMAAAEKNNANVYDKTSIKDLGLTPSRYGENIHTPEFVNLPRELRINESVELGETITWIQARDRDLGYNGKLVYAISDGDYDSVFRIDPESGELQIIGYLDRERQDEYVLNITVYDLGMPQKSQSKVLPIFIIDSNDNAPVFQKSLASFRLTENAFNGTLIFCLNASDADSGNNAQISFILKTETADFIVNYSTGCIYSNNELDRERQDMYELHILAIDNGIPSLSSEAVINVMIEDVNDNAPTFGVQELIFKIREDIPRGTMVAYIEATDLDLGPNGDILFSLQKDVMDDDLFKIDKHTGIIRTQEYLDYERRQVHNLIVSAIDCGSPSLMSNITVVIEVIDVNENRYHPEFDDFVYAGTIKENQPKGTLVMNVTATDLDTSESDSKLSYSIRGGNGLRVFSVNDQGSIRTMCHLDAETASSYWLTLCAQDHAIVPLSNCVQVYIAVENENDNVPLTDKPVYYVSIPEGSPENTSIIQLNATDRDVGPEPEITYKIISGNPEGFFVMNSTTGELKTTERKLDRENQSEHILEISISDNGEPALTSTTRVVVSVEDVNDHNPEFDQRFYKIQIPSSVDINTTVFQVHAIDNDIEENGRISYYIKSGKGKNKFRMDAETGEIFLLKPLDADVEYDLNIRAEDNGNPKRGQNAKINMIVISVPVDSPHPPVIKTHDYSVDVTESDRPGFLVSLVQATDVDNDLLWYNITAGDKRNEFYIGRDNGNILLAKSLDWEVQQSYNLTISVTDGTHVVNTQLHVQVVDINDNRPQFSQDIYHVNISENIEEEAVIMQLHATDKDQDNKIFYTLHATQDPSSLSLFRVDSVSGNVLVTQRLDFEKNKYHVLIVIAKDQGTPAKRNYAKIVITVYDHNDHYPEFTSKIVQSKVPESAAIGSKVAELTALDLDSGKNAELRYSILTGNIGNTFVIDRSLGIVTLAKSLNMNIMQEFILQIKASDLGDPPLSSQIPLHIIVTMSENDPPIFLSPMTTIDIYENLELGVFVCQVEARSSSSLFYDITNGNDGEIFIINPSTGVITTNGNIDYEKNKFFNITVSALNMASASSSHYVTIHILDVNDNPPVFEEVDYKGIISEGAEIGSFVRENTDQQNKPLLMKVHDLDEGVNGMIEYKIMGNVASEYFKIDSSTGAVKIIKKLDYEFQTSFVFEVMVNDLGTPKLFSESLAKVTVLIENINDCAPVFKESHLNATIYLPTYENVVIANVTAIDADLDDNAKIRYDIIDGNVDESFQINHITGIITIRNIQNLGHFYELHVRASDGLYSSIAQIDVKTELLTSNGFTFQKSKYIFSTMENSTKIVTVGLVNVVGTLLHENVEYHLLSPTDMFQIGKTSGAIKTTGFSFDREVQDAHIVIVEAKSTIFHKQLKEIRRASVVVEILILDINDNCPIFVNLPYYATVSIDDSKGMVITTVKAIDLDSYENGEVRYEMKKGNGEIFKVDRKTGEVTLKQSVEGHKKSYDIVIAAYDGAITPCSTDVEVNIKVVDKSIPIFNKQFYSTVIGENAELLSALPLTIRADSQLDRKLIYTITKGNEEELFEIDYRTGTLYVVNFLDYETKQHHELIVRATDSTTGIFAEVLVSIAVEDYNDCYPEIEHDNYNITILESLHIGAQILKINATDRDSKANGELSYFIESVNGANDSNVFYIEETDGSLYIKSDLDFEVENFFYIIVGVKDHGIPSLQSRANIWITVSDVNDNFPRFIEPSFSCHLSINAKRGQFVTIVKAFDLDHEDNNNLLYRIIDGNDLQTYAIKEKTGIITLQNMQNFSHNRQALLNVSVTDGIHTSYARVKITLIPENNHAPKFSKNIYEASIMENGPTRQHVITVQAEDLDFGKYSRVHFKIVSDEMRKYFEVDKINGSISTKVSFDREERASYDVFVQVMDEGGKTDFATVKITIDDMNDNSPIINVKEYKLVANINSSVNVAIFKIQAYDADQDRNGQVTYMIVNSTLSPVDKDLISIDEQSGSLYIAKSSMNISDKQIQFFVRAVDQGVPPLHTDIPVFIQFTNSNEFIPEFEKSSVKLMILESTPPGTSLTKLRTFGNFSTKLSIITDSPKFSISETEELILIETLDREETDVHYITVMSETATIPVLFAYCEISITILDENDNSPKFENGIYNIEVAENIARATSLMKISATDKDIGANGSIRYYIEDESNLISNIFDIDIYSGWLTLLNTLDREIQSEYHFHVLATDNGHPKHVTKTSVVIKVIDYNDNPPSFLQENNEILVEENALPGTVLKHFLINDLDSDSDVLEFYILSGDNFTQFQISKTGELFVAKKLDRELIANYNLTILVTDGKFTSKTGVLIKIQDANDNFPLCLTPRYNLVVNESTAIGTSLAKINAVDFDENANGKLRYYITGNSSDDFFIEKYTGRLKVAKNIDRETQPRYSLIVHVQDGHELLKECISELLIEVTDLNDNKPQFSMPQFITSIPENAPIGTLVTKIHATDKDFGLNRKVKYLFPEESNTFSICPMTGIVKLSKSLDRENVPMFNISVIAEDFGEPKQYSTTRLIINVLDINDNPPEFSMKEYTVRVYENSSVNSEIAKVFATSKDIGVNAEIMYFITGGNEQKKFTIVPDTGAIYIHDELDYEKTRNYYLTIQAVDGGTPPLSSLAFVNITVLDVNDNQPRFSQNMYRAKVPENIENGKRIVHIVASDDDSGQNGVIRYSIDNGDSYNHFKIEISSGYVVTVGALDRETIPNYSLEVKACDNGIPELCNHIQVLIDVMDVNDNPPVFKKQNYTVVLQENKELGYEILRFEIFDADESPNSSPYTFDLRSGNEGGFFRIESDGTLRTAARFNHKISDFYSLHIRVFDNGTPPLYSDTWVYVRVIEESQYPPIITPLEITVKSLEDDFTGGYLGCVYASDQDKYDVFKFGLSPTSGELYIAKDLFNISEHDGSIYAITNLDVGMYKINVTVSDGKYISHAIITVNVEIITNEMVQNSVAIVFRKISPEAFILSHRKGFIRAIRAILRCRLKDIEIIAIQKSELQTNSLNASGEYSLRKIRSQPSSYDNLHVVFAVKKQQITPTSEAYFSTEEIRKNLISFINEIEDNTNLVVEEILSPNCSVNFCIQGECHNGIILSGRTMLTFSTDVISFSSPSFNYVNECRCKQGFGGRNCSESINACASNPCPLQKNCLPANTTKGFQCVCPRGFTGQFCENNSDKCSNFSCVNNFTSVSFNGKSYAHYKINKAVAKNKLEHQFLYSLKIRTVQQTATLLYSSGKIDYHILEIFNGAVQYRFELGSGEGLVSVSSVYISDGEWHSIALERIFNRAKVIVDDKHVSQGSAPGVNAILNTQTNDIFVGAEIRPHPSIIGFEDVQRGFVGCMAEIRISLELLPLYISGGNSIAALKRFTNVEFTCDPANVLVHLGICGGQPCLNGGMCIDLGSNGFKCTCHARFTGRICELDLDPCASSPCLFGGRCESHYAGNYSCSCPLHLSGKRCEYGKYCLPNPCKNGGICEEGDGVPHCMCRGYTGPTCEIDVNECDNQPCGNGATCINEAGSFRCICPSYLTGASCGDPLYSNSISTRLRNLSVEQITGIIAGIAIIVLVLLVVLCLLVVKRNSSSKRNQPYKASHKSELNSLVDKERYNKQNMKLSNLKSNHRPVSYTSTANDNMLACNTTFVNNLDILRSYGSAGDELENIPFEYQKIHRTNELVNLNDADVAHKRDCCEQLHLKTFSETKLNNERQDYSLSLPSSLKSGCGKIVQVAMPKVCHTKYTEYPSLNTGQYHWDCSDWVGKNHNPLPDITEVPSAEIADSSSFQSNESNESIPRETCFLPGGSGIGTEVDPTRDITTLNEDLISECVDSDLDSCIRPYELPLLNTRYHSRLTPHNDFDKEDYYKPVPLTYDPEISCEAYLKHPNSYLPSFNEPSETDGDTSGVEPKSESGRKHQGKNCGKTENVYVFENRNRNRSSNSDTSVHLCEIDDSELEDFVPTTSKHISQ